MFWKFHSPSSAQIDAILQQENVSLSDLMEEEELLQECKAQNKKLIDFLSKNDVLEELVSLIVTEPPNDCSLQARFKHSSIACELLTCDIPVVVDNLASSPDLLQKMYKFLQQEKPLNPLLASFVSRLFGMLFKRRSEQNWYSYQVTCFQVIDFLKNQNDFVDLAVTHIGTSAIMDLISKLICSVDEDDLEIKRRIHEWLDKSHLIEKLVEKLSPHCSPDENSSVDQVLNELIPKVPENASPQSAAELYSGVVTQSKLFETLQSDNVINMLMNILVHEDKTESSVSHVINILINLLSYKCGADQNSFVDVNCVESNDDIGKYRTSMFKIILEKLPALHEVLTCAPKNLLLTAYGAEVEKLGAIRLKVVALISALISTKDFEVHSTLVSLNTLHLLFKLFFQFPLNNFLHTLVTQCMVSILKQDSQLKNLPETESNKSDCVNGLEEPKAKPAWKDRKRNRPKRTDLSDACSPLLAQLISGTDFVQSILKFHEGQQNGSQKPCHNLIGYGGHLREMANALVESSSEGNFSSVITLELQNLPADVFVRWKNFKDVTLIEINERNKVLPLQDKEYKEEMDGLRFVAGFKDSEDGDISNGQHHPKSLSGLDDEYDLEEGRANPFERFQELCTERNSDSDIFDEHSDKEQKIYSGFLNCDDDDKENEAHSSSDEEVVDHLKYDDFDILRNEDKMDVEFDNEWTDVFDQRCSILNASSEQNPWQTAPASDTVGMNCWADFSHFGVPSFEAFKDESKEPFSGCSGVATSGANGDDVDFSNFNDESDQERRTTESTENASVAVSENVEENGVKPDAEHVSHRGPSDLSENIPRDGLLNHKDGDGISSSDHEIASSAFDRATEPRLEAVREAEFVERKETSINEAGSVAKSVCSESSPGPDPVEVEPPNVPNDNKVASLEEDQELNREEIYSVVENEDEFFPKTETRMEIPEQNFEGDRVCSPAEKMELSNQTKATEQPFQDSSQRLDD